MAGSDDEQRKYKHHKAAYEDILSELMVLLTRAQVRRDNDMSKSIMLCVIDWKSIIFAHKGDLSTVMALREPLGPLENPKILDSAQVGKVYEESLALNTAATPEQMNSTLSDDFLERIADTFSGNLSTLMGMELDKKEK